MTAPTVMVPRAKVLAVLRSGRVRIVRAATVSDVTTFVEAYVRSSRPERTAPYVVDYRLTTGWACTCNAGMAGDPCAHVEAVKYVTGGGAT